MKTVIAFLVGILFFGSAPTIAAESAPPWEGAQAALEALEADLQRGGIHAVGTHAESVEAMLVEATDASVTYDTGDNVLVLADGPAEAMVAMLMAVAGQQDGGDGKQVSAVPNPYPPLALYLGAYYNEVGSHEDALRVLETGIALPRALPGSQAGDHLPLLVTERGAALTALMRWEDALAAYDEGLTIPELDPIHRARVLRGRGFALIELGRLDEASEAYRESLENEPNNPVALGEMQYIEQLRAGGPSAPPQLFAPGQQPQQ